MKKVSAKLVTAFLVLALSVTVGTIAGDKNLNYERVEHSHSELLEIVETVSDYMEDGEDEALREWLIGCGIAGDKNQVSVYIAAMDDERIDRFQKEISSSDAVVFKESSPMVLDVTADQAIAGTGASFPAAR